VLPWVQLQKHYEFDGPDGRVGLLDLFDGRSQLIVYHFMLGPGWGEGCPSCSFWADGYDGLPVHLARRDASLVAVSRAPYPEIAAYRERMGWSFPWYSSAGSDFNFDFGVSFTSEQQRDSDGSGAVFHTYSTYSRGLDPFNAAYQLLDLTPKGRDEHDLPWTMAWLRRHDEY